MNEQGPFHDIDLQELYAEIERFMNSSRTVGDKSKDLSAIVEVRDLLEQKRLKFLEETVGRSRKDEDLGSLDIEQAASSFRYNYNSLKVGILWGNPADKKYSQLAHRTSLEDFANTAEKESERLSGLLENEIPNSGDFRVMSRDANRWRAISRIVHVASGIRD